LTALFDVIAIDPQQLHLFSTHWHDVFWISR